MILAQVVAVNPSAGQVHVGDLKGFFSYRLTLRDRIVYTVSKSEQKIYIHRVRTHDGES